MQRDESIDVRRCCLEDLSVWSRLLRESDPRIRGPQSPVRSDTTVVSHQSRERGRRRRAVLGQGC